MLSYAGKSYSKTRIVSPYSTRQRFLYYQLEPIKSNPKLPKHHQTLDSNLRGKNDSFLLRQHKEITLNTNHSPNYSTVQPESPRQTMPKAPLVRYIGQIRDQDYSCPLKDNCDHRCAKANNSYIQQIVSTASSKKSTAEHGKLCDSQLQTASVDARRSERAVNYSLDLSKQLQASQLKSTEPSLLKKRSKLTVELNERPLVPKRPKGLSFESSIGHKYLQQVEDREPGPDFYDLERSKQSLIRKSFRQPRVNVRFDRFRQSIATRYDRVDPDWHLSMDTSNYQMLVKDKSYDFEHYTERRMNEVKSKYPQRASMNLYSLPPKEEVI